MWPKQIFNRKISTVHVLYYIPCSATVDINPTSPSRGLEVGAHPVVEGEERGSGPHLCTHITHCAHPSTRYGLRPRPVVFYDGARSPGNR